MEIQCPCGTELFIPVYSKQAWTRCPDCDAILANPAASDSDNQIEFTNTTKPARRTKRKMICCVSALITLVTGYMFLPWSFDFGNRSKDDSSNQAASTSGDPAATKPKLPAEVHQKVTVSELYSDIDYFKGGRVSVTGCVLKLSSTHATPFVVLTDSQNPELKIRSDNFKSVRFLNGSNGIYAPLLEDVSKCWKNPTRR